MLLLSEQNAVLRNSWQRSPWVPSLPGRLREQPTWLGVPALHGPQRRKRGGVAVWDRPECTETVFPASRAEGN